MKFLVLCLFVAAVSAAPKPEPPTAYGAPARGNGGGFGATGSGGFQPSAQPLTLLVQTVGNQGHQQQQQQHHNHAPSGSYGAPSHHQQHSAGPQTQVVQKHIYVHVPPPDTEEEFHPAPAPALPQKHYKIIFIKAPSSGGGQQFSPAVAPQVEEKTLVYVLVKKPEAQEHFDAPVVPHTPSKPEVYFIKYRAKTAGGQHHQQSPSSGYGAPAQHDHGHGDFSGAAAAAAQVLLQQGDSYQNDHSGSGHHDLSTLAAGASAAEGLLHGAVDPRHNGLSDGPYHKKK